MRIGITGSSGMIGWQMRCHLKQYPDYAVVIADRATILSADKLQAFVADVDAVVHLAAQNRGEDSEIASVNPQLAKNLADACEAVGATPQIVYSSSTHINGDSVYGQSKRQAGQLLADWAGRTGARFTNLVIPHVFGEGTRPFHNSAVATFAYQLANDEMPKVITDAELELVHAQDVCAEVMRVITERRAGDIRMEGRRIRVSEVLAKLQAIAASYRADVVPDLGDAFDCRLFNLYRSYLFPDYYPHKLKLNTDNRGMLVEAIKADNGGQAFFSTTEPGVTRGNHFHFNKVERFLVVDGQATIAIRRLFDDVVHSFDVSGDEPAFIDMPTLHTHNITNTSGSRLLTIFWANEIFDPENPDTIAEPV